MDFLGDDIIAESKDVQNEAPQQQRSKTKKIMLSLKNA
jgi:hypothetical protein